MAGVRGADRLAQGYPFLEYDNDNPNAYDVLDLFNVFVSQCFECERVSIWIHKNLIYPQSGDAPLANPDLPEDIRRDYYEASSILDRSPRGAAALLRLAIQKLCKELEPNGKDLHDAIKKLVAKGLDVHIQQALDVVRVIGNEAVRSAVVRRESTAASPD